MSSPEHLHHILHQSHVNFPPNSNIGDDASRQTTEDNRTNRLPLEQPNLHGIDFGNRATWNKIVTTVSELQKFGADALANRILGLPENTTGKQVEVYIYQQDAIYIARDYGLSDDISEEVIDELLREEETEKLKAAARLLGLPQDSTGNQIHEQEMRLRAKKLGLPENVSWAEIWAEEKEQKRKKVFECLGIQEESSWDWEDLIRRALCISGIRLTTEDYVKRIEEVRTWHIERIVKGEANDQL